MNKEDCKHCDHLLHRLLQNLINEANELIEFSESEDRLYDFVLKIAKMKEKDV